MAKSSLTPDTLVDILARIPEGFIHRGHLADKRNNGWQGDAAIKQAVEQGRIGRDGSFLFDKTRLNEDKMRELASWSRPSLPSTSADGKFLQPTIWEQRKRRRRQFDNPAYLRLFDQFAQGNGYLTPQQVKAMTDDQPILANLVHGGALEEINGFIYDPLLLSQSTVEEVIRKQQFIPLRNSIAEYLQQKTNQTAPLDELSTRFGAGTEDALTLGGLVIFTVQAEEEGQPQSAPWVRLENSSVQASIDTALNTLKVPDESWDEALRQIGAVIRPGALEGKTTRGQVIARSYTIAGAAKRLGVSERALSAALHEGRLSAFTDPEGVTRFSAELIEMVLQDAAYLEQITAYEVIKVRDLAVVCDVNYGVMRKRVVKSKIDQNAPHWGDVRGRWDLPETLREFKLILREKLDQRKMARVEKIAERDRILSEQRRILQEQRDRERRERDELRAKLVAAFPTWKHEGRADQQITIHVGPPNSGKTHMALERLATAESGWYLAPLRLLAFEIFDRLNRRGVLCNLLTGEEFIPIPGATITAATIEMFDPHKSGEVVIVDESQMVADADRGWAWTRAIMEAQSQEIRVICPPTAQKLIEQMAKAAAIPYNVITHDRLAPIEVSKKYWTLKELPPRTILVAFSRQSVLHLKTELERMKRTVSVIYGNLPPEVRRKQADRFATGQTEICVATDAVGMGLNLPADNVCFYELQKFDGKKVRSLMPSEVQQIGGRAGRYGLSQSGEVGATNKRDLNLIKQLFSAPQPHLTHARVAPTVDDLEMIPGSLAEKLAQWSALQSVPESLRNAIRTADLGERIELARMLTDDEINSLGLATALKLINAPTRQSTRAYWYECARAILKNKAMPLPPRAPRDVSSASDLELIESCVSSADIYLWLSCRPEFADYAPDDESVRELRVQWSEQIDEALLKRIDTARRCQQCGRPLSASYRFSMCESCYQRRFDVDEVEIDYP